MVRIMADKPEDKLPDSIRPHIPKLDDVFSDDDSLEIIRRTELPLQDGVTISDITNRLRDAAKARLVWSMSELQPHPRNYYDRLKIANDGLLLAIEALRTGEDWTGWSDWPNHPIRDQIDEPFAGCQDNYDSLNAALSAVTWLEQKTRQAMQKLKADGLSKQGRKSVESRNVFLSALARLFRESLGVSYKHQNDWRHPFYKFAMGADSALLRDIRCKQKEYAPYAVHSSVKDLSFDDMHAILRKDKSVN